jgi:hypothetical protein
MAQRTTVKLTREVEPPQRSSQSIGVLLVASSAMFFAIASSAFILRARMVHYHAAHGDVTPRERVMAPVVLEPTSPGAPMIECGAPTVHLNGDGTANIEYTTCTTAPVLIIDDDGVDPVIATQLPPGLTLAR